MLAKENTTKGGPRISFRGGFSDRNGIRPENQTMQLNDLDYNTRVSLSNRISCFITDKIAQSTSQQFFSRHLLSNCFHYQVDYSGYYDFRNVIKDCIEKPIMEEPFDLVFTLLEFLIHTFRKLYYLESFEEIINSIFTKEYVGYRVVNHIIVRITDSEEITAINDAINSENAVGIHLEKALSLLSDRNNPDYENSIKESISAVEAMCNLFANTNNATLSKVLEIIRKKKSIHPALLQAFEKLYGYTSDAKGVRHSGDLGGSNSTFEEAQFMLVACSAFVNYLKGCSSYK